MKDKNICKFTPASLTEVLSVSCFVMEANPDIMSTPYTLQEHRMLLVTTGSGCIHLGRQTIPVSRGILVFGFAGEAFSAAGEADFSYMYLRFSGPRADALLHRFHIRAESRCYTGFEGLIPFWSESLSRASDRTIDLAAESVLLHTFSRLFENCAQRETMLGRVIALTEAHFQDPALSLSTIAEELNYNAKYLSHTFKKQTGVSFSEYLRSLRIKYAVSLLEHGLDSVKNVALLSGFTDPLYFSSVFKSSLGVSPREYQNSLNQKTTSDTEV